MTIQEVIKQLIPYKRIILTVIGLIAVLLIAVFVFQSCGDWLEMRGIDKDKQNVNILMDNANSIKGDLNNLAINEALKELEVNIARNDFVNKQLQTDNAKLKTNEALENLKRLGNKDYNGKTLSDLLKAQCEAMPETCR